MVNYSQIERQLASMFGAGPQGDPAAIRACAREFRNDAREVAARRDALNGHHRRLAEHFQGPAANKVAARMQKLLGRLDKHGQQLEQTAAALDAAAIHLESEKSAFKNRVQAGRAKLIAQARAAEHH